jgi:integrase
LPGDHRGSRSGHRRKFPIEPELADVLRWHGRRLVEQQAREADVVAIHEDGIAEGWMFPSSTGTLRTPNSLDRAWIKCREVAQIDQRFTVHGLRYTYTDLLRKAMVDPVLRRKLVGHVTEEMQKHYSSVALDEMREASASVFRLVAPPHYPTGGDRGGDRGVERESAA